MVVEFKKRLLILLAKSHDQNQHSKGQPLCQSPAAYAYWWLGVAWLISHPVNRLGNQLYGLVVKQVDIVGVESLAKMIPLHGALWWILALRSARWTSDQHTRFRLALWQALFQQRSWCIWSSLVIFTEVSWANQNDVYQRQLAAASASLM